MCAMRRVRLTKRQIIQKITDQNENAAPETYVPQQYIDEAITAIRQCRTFHETVTKLHALDYDLEFFFANIHVSDVSLEVSTLKRREEKRKENLEYLDEALDNEYYYHDEDMTADMYQL